jgi:hypothetical protein
MPRFTLATWIFVAGGLGPAAASAQVASEPDEPAWFIGGAVGFGWGTLAIGSDPEIGSEFGAVLSGQAGLSRSGRRTWMVEVETQLFDVPSPLVDERFRAVRALVRRSLGAPFYVTPGVGLEYRRWDGAERLEATDTGLVLGVGFGRHVRIGAATVLHPEISWSYGFVEREGAVSGAGVSLRLGVVRLFGG